MQLLKRNRDGVRVNSAKLLRLLDMAGIDPIRKIFQNNGLDVFIVLVPSAQISRHTLLIQVGPHLRRRFLEAD